MKKDRSFLFVGAILLLVFVSVSLFTFSSSRKKIENGYLDAEGKAAQNFAVLTAQNIHLTDGQVQRLKDCSYAELMKSVENQELQHMMDSSYFQNKVDYAYLMIHLKGDEVKYTVTDENSSSFDAPIGTKLDIMWLLDVNVSNHANVLQDEQGKNEYERYSYYIDEDAAIFGSSPTYIYNSSEWGDHICGYAPVYSLQGTYIGVIGVDLMVGDYTAYCDSAVWAMILPMVVSILLLVVLFVYIYQKYRIMQFDKIYRDPLTKVYNRSYYNSRFTKVMNSKRTGTKFALMITDVDFFKKVNDTFGHEVGDEVLAELGVILTETFGMNGVVRFGGEEFVSGMWFSDEKELNDRLDEFFGRIAAHKFSSRRIELTVSLGCGYHDAEQLHGWLVSGLLSAADLKLYEAKESGRNKYIIEAYDENKNYQKNSDKPIPSKEVRI